MSTRIRGRMSTIEGSNGCPNLRGLVPQMADAVPEAEALALAAALRAVAQTSIGNVAIRPSIAAAFCISVALTLSPHLPI